MKTNPTFTPPLLTETYTPTNASDLESNPNKIAIITNSFNASGVTLASGQIIRPNGGIISGTNINLNDAYIEENELSAFSSTATFSSIYDKSRLRPETFNGISDDAISALINNSEFATLTTNQVYTKNKETTHNRYGLIDWDLNGAKIETTNDSQLSHGSEVSNQNKYLFFFDNLNFNIYNGELDGNDLASRCIRFDHNQSFYLEDLHIHNYYAPPLAYARGVAILGFIRSNTTYNFTLGEIYNCNIENIGAATDNNANNSPYGISKGIWFSQEGDELAEIKLKDNVITNIYGDDAEAFYNDKLYGGHYDYELSKTHYYLDNETYTAAQRRSIKITLSNATITDCSFTSATNAPIFNGAQAGLVSIFSTSSTEQAVKNITFKRNNVSVVGDAQNVPWIMTECKDMDISNNTFSYHTLTNTSGFIFGTSVSGRYSGDISNTVIIKDNTFTNIYFEISSYYDPINGGAEIYDNEFNLTWNSNPGNYVGAIRVSKYSGEVKQLRIRDCTYNIDLVTNPGIYWQGVVGTFGASPKNWELDNLTINYTGNYNPNTAIAAIGQSNRPANFDSTNVIKNCTLTGVIGTDAIEVSDLDGSVVIQNSYGDNNTPITVEGVSPVNRPVITLNGSTPVEITQGGTYAELGATWTDTEDGTGNATVGGDTVDTSIVGTYIVTYNHTDTDSNAAVQVTRTVNVVEGSTPVEDSYGIDFNLFLSI